MNKELANYINIRKKQISEKLDDFSGYTRYLLENNYYNYLIPLDRACDRKTVANGKEYLIFSSNNYLGLINNREVKDFVKEAVEKYGTGSSGSPLLSGTNQILLTLEKELAEFKGAEDTIIYPCGYSANIGAISALVGKYDLVLCDKLNHASVIDGIKFSGAKLEVYKHNDMANLKMHLNQAKDNYKNILIITDSIFSVDGDIANIPEIVSLAKRYKALTMIDEAHATGVLGKTGRGTLEYYGLEGKVDFVMGTLSKALASQGGFICTTKKAAEYLRFISRSHMFSTGLSPANIAAALASLRILKRNPNLVQKLQENTAYFVSLLEKESIKPIAKTPIVAIVVEGAEKNVFNITRELFGQGMFVSGIAFPATPKGKGRIRLSIMASHTREDLETAAKIVSKSFKKHGR